jgi:hypothetical protein
VTTLHPSLTATKESDIPQNLIGVEFPWPLKTMLDWPRGGEWERALIGQPPCKRIRFFALDGTSDGTDGWAEDFELEAKDEEGVRLGQVVEILRDVIFPQRKRARAAKKSLPKVDLERFAEVEGLIRGSVLARGDYVRQAEAHEKWETALQEEAIAVAAEVEQAQGEGIEEWLIKDAKALAMRKIAKRKMYGYSAEYYYDVQDDERPVKRRRKA